MPKISAPTVREHHEAVKARLVEATERLLREGGVKALSAGAVAEEVGIARNSIYRYVDSVEDLKMLAIERHIPEWASAISRSVDESASPEEKLVQFARASLQQSVSSSHSWFMELMSSAHAPNKHAPRATQRFSHGISPRESAQHGVDGIHGQVDTFIADQWAALDVPHQEVWAAYTRNLVFESFKISDQGGTADEVGDALAAAIHGLVSAARSQKAAEVS